VVVVYFRQLKRGGRLYGRRSMMIWLWDQIAHYPRPLIWVVAAPPVVVLAVTMSALVLLWPRSHRWAVANKLHSVASRNALGIRKDTRTQLDESLLALSRVRREAVADGDAQMAKLEDLIHRIEVARDRVDSSYIPTPANARHVRRPPDLEQLSACESLAARCKTLRVEVHHTAQLEANQLDEVGSLMAELDEGWLTLS
jgi:hypothetical protein